MKRLSVLFGLFFFFVFQALANDPPAPPTNLTVAGGLLAWTPVASQTGVTFTVQVNGFEDTDAKWRDVPTCVRTTSTRCNVSAAIAEDSEGCARLRVTAERAGKQSEPVETCSQHGDSCSPSVILSANPGTLIVHLNRNNPLVTEYADSAGFRVYHGPDGEQMKGPWDTQSTLTLPGLDSGQRYCVQVGFTLYTKDYGPPSCTRCLLVPHAETSVVLTVVLILVPAVALIVATVYVLIFHYGMIKRWLSLNRYHIPAHVTLKPFPAGHSTFESSHRSEDEHFDVISSITPSA
ncbi:interferon gamma receptor 2 [Nelusetta ayraudi]|uniref:interferon gamma receptor 2 n=1 Tax=Nelusetta ayraudi TaxID=303726 RepID=UPI003F72C893